MRKIVYGETDTEAGRMTYYLLERELAIPGGTPLYSYGAGVRGGEGEERVPDITPSQTEIGSLMALLAGGGVLPAELPYVVEDWLARA